MRNFYFLLGFCLVLLTADLSAQTRYIDPMFEVSSPETITYATNINVRLMGPQELTADVYQPVDDDSESLRPCVVLFHTGNFLPQYFNGGAYGAKNDSVNVEVLSRLVERGYVGMSATYRDGWQPTAESQDVRVGSLLQAVYRASQDAHAMARYLRMTVAEMDNPYQIDTNRIVFWGVGSGGYVVQAHNFLDDVDQIALNAKFYSQDGNLLVDENVISNVEGTTMTPQNLPNHVGYGSDVALTVNMGGALGDTLWIDGEDNEAPIISHHSATDPFAPYFRGTVIVPTDPPMPVVDVEGSRLVVQLANELGINDVLAPANEASLPAIFPPLSSVVNNIVNAYEQAPFMSPIATNTDDVFQLGVDNLWTVLRTQPGSVGLSGATSGVWNWFDETTLRGTIAAINAQVPNAMLDADRIIEGEEQTNPNWDNAAAAKANLDTVMAHFIPRAWYALELEELVGTNDLIDNARVGLEVFPNPAGAAGFTVKTAADAPVRNITIVDVNGRVVANYAEVNSTNYTIARNGLPRGTYVLRLQFDDGVTSRKLIME